jgi:selenide,water dikinase
LITNDGAEVGDLLFLTKPLGAGSITTGVKRDVAKKIDVDSAVAGMIRLNDTAARAMKAAEVKAATDITGFGLIGHAFNIARASNVELRFSASAIPLYDGALDLAKQGVISGASSRGRDIYGPNATINADVPQELADICFDAETSGGLLVCVHPDNVDAFSGSLGAHDLFVQIGEVVAGSSRVSLV